MDEENAEQSSSIFLLGIVALALVLGGAGLYFGLSAQKSLGSIVGSAENSAKESADKINALENSLAELASQNQEVADALKRLRIYGNERDAQLKSLGEELSEQKELLKSGVTPKQSALPSSEVNTAVSSAENAGSYAIQAGDSFSKVANAKGISLQDLLNANPGVDPKRLQIGQMIVIPQN